MGKAIIIEDADFALNALDISTYYYVENNFSWGKGGINSPGVSSGSTNATMSMVGLPLEQADGDTVFVAANGYKIAAVLTSSYASPSMGQYTYTNYTSSPIDTITISSGMYYEIAVKTVNGDNADLSNGPSALLIKMTRQE